jgi:hypothetical protein
MGVQLLTLGAKEPNEVISYFLDLSKYALEAPITLMSASSVIYLATDSTKTDETSMNIYTPTISGYRIYQTVVSGSDGSDYIWRVRVEVSGSHDIYEEQALFSVREV